MIVDIHAHLGRHPLFEFEQALEEIIRDMSEYGIDKTFLHPFPRMRFRDANDSVASAVRQYPNKFVGFLCVNPTDGEALKEIERAVKLGLKGLTVDPEFYASMEQPLTLAGKFLSPLLEKAVQCDLPVLICTPNVRVGHSQDTALQMYNGLDELSGRFPEVRIVVDLFWPGITELGQRHPHLYVDTAGASAGRIADLVSRLGATRLLFGSSSPRYHAGTHKQTIRWSRTSPEQKAMILGKNAERIFKDILAL